MADDCRGSLRSGDASGFRRCAGRQQQGLVDNATGLQRTTSSSGGMSFRSGKCSPAICRLGSTVFREALSWRLSISVAVSAGMDSSHPADGPRNQLGHCDRRFSCRISDLFMGSAARASSRRGDFIRGNLHVRRRLLHAHRPGPSAQFADDGLDAAHLSGGDLIHRIHAAPWIGSAAVAMQILAGHPQYVYYTALACVHRTNSPMVAFRLHALLGFALIGAGGVCISAIQLFTGLAAASESLRSGLDIEVARTFPFPPENLLNHVRHFRQPAHDHAC